MPRAVLSRAGAARSVRRSEALPLHVAPMLAVAGALPTDGQLYNFEWKWDGVRALCYVDRNTLRLDGRQGNDISIRYPELQALLPALDGRRAILDGEIVALDDNGQPSFARLQKRMHVTDPRAIARLAVEIPVWFVLFDVLHLNDRSLMDQPYRARRAQLEELTIAGPNWQVTAAHVDEGQAMLEAARQSGLEGIVAKRLDSRYEPGRRSPSWLKIKVVRRQEFVVGGWIPEANAREDRVGAMLIGYYDGAGALHYAGRVGTGLAAGDHALLVRELVRLGRTASPFAGRVPSAGVRFTRPALIIEVEYRRWPAQGLVQQAAYKGVRRDKSPRQVVKEPTLETESDK